MKNLILSIDCIVDAFTKKPFPNTLRILENFKKGSSKREVIIISARGLYLDKVPEILNPIEIPFKLRGSGDKLITFLSKKIDRELNDVIIIGAKDADMQTAKNLKSILLRADYAKKNNPNDDIYTKDYGLPLKEVDSIELFFKAFTAVVNPWYFKIQVDKDTTFLALTSANTFADPDSSSTRIKDEFRKHLKQHKQEYYIPFIWYFIVVAHLMTRDLVEFDFWDIYPSSGKDSVNDDLLYFARKASHTFGKRFQAERIFLRIEQSKKRHTMSAHDRVQDGCDEQFKTMIINPEYRDKLDGKNVCIIDDFTRHGTSCETVRHMLKKAGANKILFIAMGKFAASKEYNKYVYTLGGDVFSKLIYKQESHSLIYGDINPKANKDFIESLRSLI